MVRPCRRPSSFRWRAWFSITSSCAVRRKSHRNRSDTSMLSMHAAEQRRQIAGGIVAAPGPELLADARRPVLRADLPAVEMHGRQAAAGMPRFADGREQRAEEGFEVRIERSLLELAGLQSEPRRRRGTGGLSGQRAAQAQDGPTAVGHLPGQAAVGREPVKSLDHLRGRATPARRQDGWIGRQKRLHAALRGEGRAEVQRLCPHPGAGVVCRRRERDDHLVAADLLDRSRSSGVSVCAPKNGVRGFG